MDTTIIAPIFGILGLFLIIIGVLVRKRKKEDIFYIFGGSSLAVYSFIKGDIIFITLQIVFTLVAIYDYWRK